MKDKSSLVYCTGFAFYCLSFVTLSANTPIVFHSSVLVFLWLICSNSRTVTKCQGVCISGLKAYCWAFRGPIPVFTVVNDIGVDCLKELTNFQEMLCVSEETCVHTAELCRLDALSRRRFIMKILISSFSFRLQIIFLSNFYEYIRKLQNAV